MWLYFPDPGMHRDNEKQIYQKVPREYLFCKSLFAGLLQDLLFRL